MQFKQSARFSGVVLAVILCAFCLAPTALAAESDVEFQNGVAGEGTGSLLRADVPVDGLWQDFYFGGAGTWGQEGSACSGSSGGNSQPAPVPPWTFTAAAPGVNLTVVDGWLVGDQFEVYDFGALVGTTSVPGASCDCDNPVVCLTVPGCSQGVFPLAPGPHEITLYQIAGVSGCAWFIPQTQIPVTLQSFSVE